MNIAPLIMVEAVGGVAPLDVVNATIGEEYGNVFTPDFPAVTSGYSLIIATQNDKADTRIDGATEISTGTTLDGLIVHFFELENITDSRTSITIRTYDTYPTPSAATTTIWGVFEVDADAVASASTVAASTGSGTAVNTAFTTSEDDAAAFASIKLSNTIGQTGNNGWVAVPGTSAYDPFAYNENVGAAGAKAVDVTLADGRNWGAVVQAFVRD